MPVKRRTLRKLGKSWAQQKHAVRRASERYELAITADELAEIVKMIQHNQIITSEKQSNRVTIKKLIYKERIIRVVYDKIRKTVVSFLPLEGLNEPN